MDYFLPGKVDCFFTVRLKVLFKTFCSKWSSGEEFANNSFATPKTKC